LGLAVVERCRGKRHRSPDDAARLAPGPRDWRQAAGPSACRLTGIDPASSIDEPVMARRIRFDVDCSIAVDHRRRSAHTRSSVHTRGFPGSAGNHR
jgi:hypothetical protein